VLKSPGAIEIGMKLITDMKSSEIVFSTIKKNRNGGKFVTVTDGSSPIFLQLPSLRAPFGLNAPNDKAKDYYISLSLTPEVETKFAEIDAAVLDFVSTNCVELMGKTIDTSVLRDILMTPIVKKPKDDKYSSTIKLKASTGEGKNLAECYNHVREEVPLDAIKVGTNLESIVEISQIYFINGKFGVSVKLCQAKISPSNKISGYSFIESTSDEIDIPDDA
jgi:hypothetical protein